MLSSNIHITIQDTLHQNKYLKNKDVHHWLKFIFKKKAEITLRLVDEKESQKINYQFRKKNQPTNVLSFLIQESPLVGDLILCHPVIKKEALFQKKKLMDHYAHLIIHGSLHLLGYDHENTSDANIMERKEIMLLKKIGIDNPY